MGVPDILAIVGETVATAVVREVFAQLDNDMDAKGEIVTRGTQLLAALAKSSDLPDRAAEAMSAFDRNRARLHADALQHTADASPHSAPPSGPSVLEEDDSPDTDPSPAA